MAKRGKSDRGSQPGKGAESSTSLPDTAAGLSSTNSLDVLIRETFGVSSLHDDQADVIKASLGNDNILVNKPTGWGKSLCYQAPAVLEHANSGRLTIVVSPLLALIREQAIRLTTQGVKVAYIDSLMNTAERAAQAELVTMKSTALVYVSPERFRTATFKQLLRERDIARVVVDEAHCISMWGHDFRPSYLDIPKVCRELGNVPLSLFTATAPVIVRDDIVSAMGFAEDSYRYFTANPDRANLHFERRLAYGAEQKIEFLEELVQKAAKSHEVTIVYVQRKTDLEDIATRLNALGIQTLRYHAGMEQQDRRDNQDRFMQGKCPIILATKAFGMGIDKGNVRNVIHFGAPSSLEDYYQEAGRAGRDGAAATCTLITTSRDFWQARDRLSRQNPQLDSIKQLYARLWRSRKEQPDGVVDTYFDLDRHFIESDQSNPTIQDMVRAAFGILQEHGLIEVHGRRVRFPMATEVDLENKEFPISQSLLDQKKLRDFERLAIMWHYVWTMNVEPRAILMDHFMHNTVARLAMKQDSIDAQKPDQRFIDFTLQKLRDEDYELGSLNRDFRSAAEAPDSPFTELGRLTPHEVRADIEHLSSLGFVRVLKVGEGTYVTLDKKGEERLQQLNTPAVHSSSWSQLSSRLYSLPSKAILREALDPWFDLERRNRSERQWWAAIEYFLDRKFEFFGEEVAGKTLLEKYFRRKYTRQKGVNPIKRHAREFLNYVFDNHIELSIRS